MTDDGAGQGPVLSEELGAFDLLMSSRRTIDSGEVVTFATGFEPWASAFGKAYRATGPFEVSASRDAVMVHRAECRDAAATAALIDALHAAERVRLALAPHWRGGHPSMYPTEPTPVPEAPNVGIEARR